MDPSWESYSHSADQEIHGTLWKPKVHYRLHKSPPLEPIPSQFNPVHTHIFTLFLRFVLILSPHLNLGIQSRLFLFSCNCIMRTQSSAETATAVRPLITTSLSGARCYVIGNQCGDVIGNVSCRCESLEEVSPFLAPPVFWLIFMLRRDFWRCRMTYNLYSLYFVSRSSVTCLFTRVISYPCTI
jgi:hypothetical protein